MAVTGKGVFLDFADEIKRMGREWIDGQYGNLFDMYEEITDDDPHETPMMIYPASHYTMGGLWVDYNLMSNVKGLHVLGEANFSDHGANRLGASALMQGLSDGYFVIPATLPAYLTTTKPGAVTTAAPEFKAAEDEQAPECEGHQDGGLLPPGTGPHYVGRLRHGPHGRKPDPRH